MEGKSEKKGQGTQTKSQMRKEEKAPTGIEPIAVYRGGGEGVGRGGLQKERDGVEAECTRVVGGERRGVEREEREKGKGREEGKGASARECLVDKAIRWT